MTKRKLYEEKLVKEKYSDDIVNGVLIESRLTPITEKEIVKPYLENIIAEITEDLLNAEKESKSTQDDIDCGICIGLQMAIDTINKRQGRK